MIGAIIGDIVGSRHEFKNILTKDFQFFHPYCCFTDDTVMTCAVAESLMRASKDKSCSLEEVAVATLHEIGRHYPNCGYGGKFFRWMLGDDWTPYNSFGNGSAMRISAVGDIAGTVDEAKRLAHAVTCISHDHPEGLKGAEAAAVAKVLLKQGKSKDEVRSYIEKNYYALPMTVDEYRAVWQGHGKEICQVSMPQAFVCFFEGTDFEDVIRNCISIGGDSDTLAAIAGGIAEACYEVPEEFKAAAMGFLDDRLRDVCERFEAWAAERNAVAK